MPEQHDLPRRKNRTVDILDRTYRAIIAPIEKLWLLLRRILDPVARPIAEPIAALLQRREMRRDADDLALADMLEASGLGTSAAGIREMVVARQIARPWSRP